METQSFDAFLPDGSSITCESCGIRPACTDPAERIHVWHVWVYSADGASRDDYGTRNGSKDSMMLFAENLAETMGGE